jgi:hypothetical protein
MMMKSKEELEGLLAQVDSRDPEVLVSSRRRVLRFSASLDHHCHSRLVLKFVWSEVAAKLAGLPALAKGKTRAVPACRRWREIRAFTPNVGMAIRNRMFHADRRPQHEGRTKTSRAGDP